MNTHLQRRQLLTAFAALTMARVPAAFTASADNNAPYALSDPYDWLAAYAKTRARLDGGRAAFWYTSHSISQPENSPPQLLFVHEGVSFHQIRFLPDRSLEAVFSDCSYVLDPDTRKVMTSFNNPYTKAVNQPHHQQAMVAPTLRITPEQAINTSFNFPPAVFRDMRVRPPTVNGDTIWFNDDILFYKPAGLDEEGLPDFLPEGAMAQTELVTYRAKLSDVQNPNLVSAPATISISANIPWSRWLDMGDRPGGIFTRYMGRKLDNLGEVPQWLRRRITRDYPDYLNSSGS